MSGLEEKLVNKTILIQLQPDPYATIKHSILQRVSDVTANLSPFLEILRESDTELKIESLELLKSSLSSELNMQVNMGEGVRDKIPAFLTTKNFNYLITRDSLVITLNVMNTDALVWIEVLPRTSLTKVPKSVEELALSSGSKVFAAQKGIPLEITLKGITSVENFVFFGAQDMLTKGFSKVYSFSVNMDSQYCRTLETTINSWIIFFFIIMITYSLQ